jgi:hypothetical protein
MHSIYRVSSVEPLENYTLRVVFDDGAEQMVDLGLVLAGEIYGPLRDRSLFVQVSVDPEVGTIVWPNGADFDPETLYNWPERRAAFEALARRWEMVRI